jgi:hypothetical protein
MYVLFFKNTKLCSWAIGYRRLEEKWFCNIECFKGPNGFSYTLDPLKLRKYTASKSRELNNYKKISYLRKMNHQPQGCEGVSNFIHSY